MSNVHCKQCNRPLTIVPRQVRICTECHHRLEALAQLAEMTDPDERLIVANYARQLREAAMAKGGQFDGSTLRVLHPVREPAYAPAPGQTAALARIRKPPKAKAPKAPKTPPAPRKTVRQMKAEAPKRPRGRPVVPQGRMLTLAFRVPHETRLKFEALGGRDWFILAVARAALPMPKEEPEANQHAA